MQLKSVAVFCGSRLGNDPLYEQHAKELGRLLGLHQIAVVYGGGNVGLMGVLADAVLEAGGDITGVIPDVLVQRERQHTGLTRLHVVADMHTRKKMMYELCDAAIVLPGGNGTLDELFEMLTWNALHLHNKKIILLNTAGYYNQLIGHINHTQLQGFLHEDWRTRFGVCSTPADIITGWDAGKS